MIKTERCPICETIGFPVSSETVSSLSNTAIKNTEPSKLAACLEPSCNVAYFSGSEYIVKEDLRFQTRSGKNPLSVRPCVEGDASISAVSRYTVVSGYDEVPTAFRSVYTR